MSRSFELPNPGPVQEQTGETFPYLVRLMQRLLAPDGCPWDREQTPQSLRRYVLEEACEVMDAIDSGDLAEVADELGDLSLQIVFLSEIARSEGAFGPDDVVRRICEKLVRRHPHVFAEGDAANPEEVEANWEAIKRQEKQNRPLLDGVPRSLPALMRAHRLSDMVSRVGFDWPDTVGSRAKVTEELAELDEAIEEGTHERIESELGDLLFAAVNLARHHGVDAELALRKTTERFSERFGSVERQVRTKHGDWPRDAKGKATSGISLAEMDEYWEAAKREERSQSAEGDA